METLADLLADAVEEYGERPALSLEVGLRPDGWSYRRLWDAAHSVACYLRNEYGIRPGERVLVRAPNSPALVAAYFGCILARGILVPLDPHSTDELSARIADKTQATAIITGLGPVLAGKNLRAIQLDALPFDTRGCEISERPKPSDIVEIVFTSGTTGDPKGVILTHQNIIANVNALNDTIPHNRHYRLLSLLPLSHMLEQTVGLYLPLSYGASIHYLASRQPSAVFRTLQRRRIVAMVVVPLVLELLWRGIEQEVRRRGRDGRWQRAQRLAAHLPMAARRLLFHSVHEQLGGCLDFFICGGAYLPPDLAEVWERLGVKVIQGYGTTECAPVVATNTWYKRVQGSVGRPIQGLQVRMDEDGEVLVKGPNVTPGYWQDETATCAAFTDDGWYRSGDLAEQDAQGYLFLKGRRGDRIVLANGLNVYPEDIERELVQENEINDCVVLGLPDAAGNLRLHAVIRPAMSEDATPAVEQAVKAAVRRANERLAPYQRITTHTLWPEDDFPRTNTMKVKRYEVQARITGTTPIRVTTQPRPRPRDESERLRHILAEIGGLAPESIRPDDHLSDLGFDSLARVELAIHLEKELGSGIDDSEIAVVETVAQLVQRLKERRGERVPVQAWSWPLRRPARWLRYILQVALLFPLHHTLGRPFRVEGHGHLRGLSGPVLFIANHNSHLDTPSVLRALPFRLRRRVAVAAAADYFFRTSRHGFVTALLFNAFPFTRAGLVRPSFEHCAALVDEGWSLLIYPEGTRSTTGMLQPFKSGTGLLARELRIPVVPIGIEGTHHILPKGASWPRPGPVTVRFGTPVTVPNGLDLWEITALLEESVSGLVESSGNAATYHFRRGRECRNNRSTRGER